MVTEFYVYVRVYEEVYFAEEALFVEVVDYFYAAYGYVLLASEVGISRIIICRFFSRGTCGISVGRLVKT